MNTLWMLVVVNVLGPFNVNVKPLDIYLQMDQCFHGRAEALGSAHVQPPKGMQIVCIPFDMKGA